MQQRHRAEERPEDGGRDRAADQLLDRLVAQQLPRGRPAYLRRVFRHVPPPPPLGDSLPRDRLLGPHNLWAVVGPGPARHSPHAGRGLAALRKRRLRRGGRRNRRARLHRQPSARYPEHRDALLGEAAEDARQGAHQHPRRPSLAQRPRREHAPPRAAPEGPRQDAAKGVSGTPWGISRAHLDCRSSSRCGSTTE